MAKLNVLVSGGGVAGPVLAFWLARAGIKTTIVERHHELRTGGQGIDLRGAAIEVVRSMGLLDAVRSQVSHEEGLSFVDGKGKPFAKFGVEKNSNSFTSEFEILRGDLVKILYDATKDDATYIFDDHVTGLENIGEKVKVTFEKGVQQEFDLVVGADGQSSKTRRLAWGEESGAAAKRCLGMFTSFFTIPKINTDGMWARWYNTLGGRVIFLRPDNKGTTRAFLSIMNPAFENYQNLDIAGQKKLYREYFADAGWEAKRVLEGMDQSSDFYMQEIVQVKMKSWSKGRVVMLGDAGYCPSPISGMGTALAVVGAYILAGELGRCASVETAFAAYELKFRPYVENAQSLPPGMPALANPQSAWGVWLFGTILSFVYRSGLAKLISKFIPETKDNFDLPKYELCDTVDDGERK